MNSSASLTRRGGWDCVTVIAENCAHAAGCRGACCVLHECDLVQALCPSVWDRWSEPGEVGRKGEKQKGACHQILKSTPVSCPSTRDWRAGELLRGNLLSPMSLTVRAINTLRVTGGWETWGDRADLVSNSFLATENVAKQVGGNAFLRRRKLEY